ncbi:MAG: hypothetical protein IIC88_05400 [Chloroflexi bacterium]|nr:hypothetical protein [Chloroflexota bacterium]
MPHIYLDAGIEDGLISEAREFTQILMINDVPYDYMQSLGRHNAEYWRRSIGHMMAITGEANQIFRPVTMFDYGIDGGTFVKDGLFGHDSSGTSGDGCFGPEHTDLLLAIAQ